MTKTVKAIQIVADESEAARIKALASREGLQVWTVSMAGVTSKASLLQAIGTGLSFPDYYRPNWDSLEECLRDLDDSSRGWIIAFEQADVLLSLQHEDVVILACILSETSNFWSTDGKIFSAVFIGSLHLTSALAA